MPKTVDRVIVDHPHRLHKSITNGRANKLEAPLGQVSAQSIGFRGTGRNLLDPSPPIPPRLATHELPNISIETAELPLNCEEGASVLDGGNDFKPVANDTRIREQIVYFVLIILRDEARIKTIKGHAVVIPLLQDDLPAQAGLGPLQNEKLKEFPVVVQRNSPLLVVVGERGLRLGPFTALHQILLRQWSGFIRLL